MDIVNFFKRTHVEKSGCVVWDGAKGHGGYGRVRQKNKLIPATHYIWEWYYGEIPSGFIVCHRCDNPPCVNIDHLFLGTYKDNSDDMMKKGRFKIGSRVSWKFPDKEKLAHARAFFTANPRASARAWLKSEGCPVTSPESASKYKKAVQ